MPLPPLPPFSLHHKYTSHKLLFIIFISKSHLFFYHVTSHHTLFNSFMTTTSLVIFIFPLHFLHLLLFLLFSFKFLSFSSLSSFPAAMRCWCWCWWMLSKSINYYNVLVSLLPLITIIIKQFIRSYHYLK